MGDEGATMTIGVLDYGVGNVGSILSMLRRIGTDARRVDRADQLSGCSSAILPGIGAFDDVVKRFRASGLSEPLTAFVRSEGRPLLGICVGLQMLADASEEGVEPGLGWIPGVVRHLRTSVEPGTRLPIMGWYYVDAVNGSAVVQDEAGARQRYYFTHSYALECEDPRDVAATVDHGSPVTAAIQRGHVWATQFHPEKSHTFGMAVLRRFAKLTEGEAA
jgi:glutamine amidotransferase